MEESKATDSNVPSGTAKGAGQGTSAGNDMEKQTLYVGNLKPGITSSRLYSYFTDQKFSVVNAKVRVASKDPSNVFGIVKFCSEAEAQKALDLLNNSELDDCKLRLMWFNTNIASKDKEEGNIYVKGLHPSITQKDLSDRFSVFGNVLSVKLETFANNTSRGYGYVQFEETEDAQKAIKEMNGVEWKGKTIEVTKFKKPEEREDKKALKNNVYCKNFPQTYEEGDLRKLFEPYGEITSLLLKRNAEGKKQAFICFQTGDQAKKAIDELHGKKLDDTNDELVVTELLTKNERHEENMKNYKKMKEQHLFSSLAQNLYVSGIPKTCSEDDIRKEFEKFGPISSIKMNMKPSFEDKSKIEFVGSAFVCFENAEDAKTAVYRGSMEPLFGRNLHIDYYKPKEFKKKEKQEEAGVTMKHMIHNFMMSALSQTRGDFRGRPHRGGRGGRGGHSGYGGPGAKSSYAGSSYGRPPMGKPDQQMSAPPFLGGMGPGNPPRSGPPVAGMPPPQPPMAGPPIGQQPTGGSQKGKVQI